MQLKQNRIMAENNTTYYQSRHTGEEIDDLLDQSIAATEAANASAKKANDAAENANQEAAKIPGMVTGKADLDPATGFVESSQIAPLQGRQTGVNTTDGNFRSAASALLFPGARTIAANFKTGHDVSGTQTVVATSGDIYGMILEFVNGNLVFRCRGAAPRVVTGIEPDTYYSVAGTYDGNEIVVYLNGGRVTSASNFSDDLNLQYLAIGSSFKGIVIGCRLFNYALTASEVVDLWNGGEPERYMLPLSGEMRTGLIAEYIAAGLLADKWRDTSGAGLDLPYVPTATGGTAELSYQSVPNQGEIVIDSGIFFTDIAEGTANKRIDVPRGYVALAVAVYNYNASALTNVIVQNWTDERAFIYGATVYNARAVYSVSAAGNKSVYNGTGITIDPTVQYLKVMATGNTTSGGMRVRVICKYLGV